MLEDRDYMKQPEFGEQHWWPNLRLCWSWTMALLVAYAIVLSVFAVRSSRQTGGISVALVALMLIRSVSEVPFATGSVMQSEFIVHLLTLCACLGFVRQPETVALPQTHLGNKAVNPISTGPTLQLRST